MATKDNNYHATVEDYDSDQSDGQVLKENFPRKSTPPAAQANVSTKRSKDLNSDQPPAQEKTMPANIDLRSDSGYSSYTAASKSSADSASSATSRSPPVAPTATVPVTAQSPAPKPRRPTGGEQRQHSNESSPRQKPLSRTASVSSKRPAGQRRTTLTQDSHNSRAGDCQNPNCTTCEPVAMPHRRRPEMQPFLSTRDVSNYAAVDQRSQRSAPDPYQSPPSPTYVRQPGPYVQGPAVVQTAQSRRRMSSSARQRPQSFAGELPNGYWVPGMPVPGYPSPPQERGPPPAISAYQMHNMQYPHIPPYMPPTQQPGYYPPTQAPMPYESQRPQMSARGSSNYGRGNYPAPIITQENNDRSNYSARYGAPPTPNNEYQMKMPPPKLLQHSQYEEGASGTESSEGEEDYEEDEAAVEERERRARALMPPPSILKRDRSQRRPPLAHAKTSQVVDRLEERRERDSRRRSIVVPDPVRRERERDVASRSNTAPARRSSVSRPPPPQRQTQSEYDTRRGQIFVNDSRHNRRLSYQPNSRAYERALDEQYEAELRRQQRAPPVRAKEERTRHIPGQFEDDEEEEPAPALRPRRKTDAAEGRKGKERISERKAKKAEIAAEDYIKSTRGGGASFADQITRDTRRASRIPSLPSDSGSSHSEGSGKASHSNRTTMTSNTNNEIRLRLNGSAPVNLQLSGDMEGRTVQLVAAENGATDLVIGNVRGNEVAYRSERGSEYGSNRRSMIVDQPRRDAEEISERSSRSGRNRRDRDEIRESRDDRDGRGHVLRRSRNTMYH